jgi:hypothetical protein
MAMRPYQPKETLSVWILFCHPVTVERNYKVFNRELLRIICTLCHWSYLLCSTVLPILIWTNHQNLMYWIEPHKVGPHAAT